MAPSERGDLPRVVFPEWDEPRITSTRDILAARSICRPVPVGEPSEGQLAALIKVRDMEERIARRLLTRPLFRAAAMVAAGEAEAMIAGVETPTRRVIEAASMAIGLAEGIAVPSSFFLMRFPNGSAFIFADCAVNITPDEVALGAIARASANSAAALLGKADVALLSYSTGTSGAGESVDLVREVAQATGFTGPIQADAALNRTVAQIKGMGEGTANVLVFPDLNAANIAYKLCQELAEARAIGPVLQGFRRPVSDLSRGASIDDIVAVTALTLQLDT